MVRGSTEYPGSFSNHGWDLPKSNTAMGVTAVVGFHSFINSTFTSWHFSVRISPPSFFLLKITVASQILKLCYNLILLLFILMFSMSHTERWEPLGHSLNLFATITFILCTFLLSGTTRYSRLVLCIFSPRPRINHFFKQSLFLVPLVVNDT